MKYLKSFIAVMVSLTLFMGVVYAEEANGVIADVVVLLQSGMMEHREVYGSDGVEKSESIYNFLEYIYRYDSDVVEIVSIDDTKIEDTKYDEFSGPITREDSEEEDTGIVLDDGDMIDRGDSTSGGDIKPTTPTAPVISEDVNIVINGELFVPSTKAFIMNGRTYLPYRALFEKLGAINIGYRHYKADMVVWGFYNGTKIEMASNNKKAYVNGVPFIMDVPVIVRNDRTFIPLKYLSDFIGAKVEWDNTNRTVNVFTK